MNTTRLLIQSLVQAGGAEPWRLGLAHDNPHHTLFWITRGQGRILLDGKRRGLGAHNAIFLPAGSLFSADLGAQSLGMVVKIPVGTPLRLPEVPRHLRIRDVYAQTELSALIDAAHREQSVLRALAQDALEAHVALMSVWLRRQTMLDEHVPPPANAGERLSRKYARLVSHHYTTGSSMAFYADQLNVTPTHLTRAVKAATGKTAADLLTERVVHAARSLLESTDHPACNIAKHLGFGSAAYFTRFMQQHAGRSPRQLRTTQSGAVKTSTTQKRPAPALTMAD